MTNLKNESNAPFAGYRKVILSPVVLYAEGQNQDVRSERRNFISSRLYPLLERDNLPMDFGRIPIEQAQFVEDDLCWGGDGIAFFIPIEYTARDVSRSVGNGVVAYDVDDKKYYIDGDTYIYDIRTKYLSLEPSI